MGKAAPYPTLTSPNAMTTNNNLNRFTEAQEKDYRVALSEIQNGRKQSHWMWYIFPQIAGLGFSETSRFYAIRDLQEAVDYLNHPVLGKRFVEISEALLRIDGKTANQIFGNPDDLKLKSSMTLFSAVQAANPVFEQVLDKYFAGQKDPQTLALITGK